MEKPHINSLIKKALNIDWEPDISADALRIIDKCGSITEKLYLLGAAYYMNKQETNIMGNVAGNFFQ